MTTATTIGYQGRPVFQAHAVQGFEFSAAYFARTPVAHAYLGSLPIAGRVERIDDTPICGRTIIHRSRWLPVATREEITCKRCSAVLTK